MYYAAAAQWVVLCEEPVCGPDTNAEVWRYHRLLKPFVPNVLKLEGSTVGRALPEGPVIPLG